MLLLQEAKPDELSSGMSDMRRAGPVRRMESSSVSTDQQPLPQSGRAAMIPAQSDSPSPTLSTHKVPPSSASLPSNTANLNALMEDLDRNMTQQGVSTVPKGHCSACSLSLIHISSPRD